MFKRKKEERKRKREMERKKGRENWLIMSAIYSQKLEVEWTVVSKERTKLRERECRVTLRGFPDIDEFSFVPPR